MGKKLRPEHLAFFRARMAEHTSVEDLVAIASDSHYLFKVTRSDGRSSLVVVLTDAYEFGDADEIDLPRETDFVVLGMPHASYDEDMRRALRRRGTGIGHVVRFMAAVNLPRPFEFQNKAEREGDAKAARG